MQVQFSPDGRWLVSASFDKAIKLWDGVKGSFVATFRGHVGPVYQVAWSADSRLFVSGSKDSTLKVRQAASPLPRSPCPNADGRGAALSGGRIDDMPEDQDVLSPELGAI